VPGSEITSATSSCPTPARSHGQIEAGPRWARPKPKLVKMPVVIEMIENATAYREKSRRARLSSCRYPKD